MTLLHMETETVQESGRTILRTATDMLDLVNSLQHSIRSLDSSWESEASSYFIQEANQILWRIQNQIQELDQLSQRVMSEAQQWMDADAIQSGSSGWLQRLLPSANEMEYMLAGTLLATNLRWSALRPNSMIFTLPNKLRKTIHLPEMLRVIKPSTLIKKMAAVAYIENGVEGLITGVQTFNDPAYRGTNRALPAAILDGVVKTAILAGGTTVLVGGSILVAGAIAATGVAAAPAIAGGAVIAWWVLGDVGLSKVAEQPLWEAWKNSYRRDQAIEGMTRFSNSVNHYVQSNVQEGVHRVQKAFSGYIKQLLPQPP